MSNNSTPQPTPAPHPFHYPKGHVRINAQLVTQSAFFQCSRLTVDTDSRTLIIQTIFIFRPFHRPTLLDYHLLQSLPQFEICGCRCLWSSKSACLQQQVCFCRALQTSAFQRQLYPCSCENGEVNSLVSW